MEMQEFIGYEKNAKFSLETEERASILNDVNRLESRFQAVAGFNAEDISPMVSCLNINNVLREDIVKKVVERDVLMQNAPERVDGYFQVPKTID